MRHSFIARVTQLLSVLPRRRVTRRGRRTSVLHDSRDGPCAKERRLAVSACFCRLFGTRSFRWRLARTWSRALTLLDICAFTLPRLHPLTTRNLSPPPPLPPLTSPHSKSSFTWSQREARERKTLLNKPPT